MKAGFALIPSGQEIDVIINLQKSFSCHAALSPTLGRVQNKPHLTLIQGDFTNGVDFGHVCHEIKQGFFSLPETRMDFDAIIVKKPAWLF